MEWVLGQPTFRKLSFQVAAPSPLGHLCINGSSVSEFYRGCRRIGKFRDRMGLVVFSVLWMGVGYWGSLPAGEINFKIKNKY